MRPKKEKTYGSKTYFVQQIQTLVFHLNHNPVTESISQHSCRQTVLVCVELVEEACDAAKLLMLLLASNNAKHHL